MISTYRKLVLLFAAVLLMVTAAAAATVTGKVTNATTGKPAAGDTVDLIALQQGMNVLATTKTDASGSFSFNVDDLNSPHLVRVTHEGVNYFPSGGPIRPGQTSTSVDVYDSAKKPDGVTTNVNVVRLQADGSTLQAVELIAVKNGSNPPRTVAGEKTYEFYVPETAQIDQVLAEAPGGMAISAPAKPEGGGKYSLQYALKPGETRFQVAYHMPYSGQASFAPRVTGDVQHFVVMMPKSMSFEAANGAKFSPMDDKTANIQVATNVTASSNLAFKVSGTGTLQDEQAETQGQGQPEAGTQAGSAMTPDNRPGGGLGPPTDAPDPLHAYRWPILGGLGIILVCGAMFVISRPGQQSATAPAPTVARPVAAAAAASARSTPAPPVDRSAMLLEGLKEELFQLELDKQQGRISESEYQAAKAALDQTLKRALARKSS
ncbi:MAG: carboxypeptidase regulatory-like domain-containing protein [Terriglobales bacterium]